MHTAAPKKQAAVWLGAFAALCLNFSPLLFNFVWGNHDWLPLITGNSLGNGLIEGRFSQYVLLNLLLMGKILPILNITLGFLIYTSALLLLCRRFFYFSAPALPLFLIISATATLPYINEILYFQFIVFSLLSWPLVIAIALIFALKATTLHPVRNTLLSALFLFMALGGYPPCVNLFVTAAACRLMLDIRATSNAPKQLFRKCFPFAASLLLALLALKLTFIFLQKHHYMMPMYNSDVNAPAELLRQIPNTLQNALASFVLPQPFFSPVLKKLTSFIVLAFAGCFLSAAPSIKNFCLRFLCLPILLLCLKFSAWLAKSPADNIFIQNDPPFFMVRADFYAMPVLILFCLLYLYQTRQFWLKNLSFTLALCLLWVNLTLNLDFCKSHLLGFAAENQLTERLIARIQESPAFSANTRYSVIQAGELPLRSKYYMPKPNEKYGYYTLKVPYTRHWIAFEYYNFYAPEDFVKEGTSIVPENITPEMVDFLTGRIKPWPSPDSIYVDQNYAIIALTPAGKNMLTGQFNLLKEQLQ